MSTEKAKKPRRATEQKLAAELHAHRDAPDEWSDEAINIRVKPKRDAVVSFRLPSEEFLALQEGAQRVGESLSEFLRKAVAARLQGKVITSAEVMASRATFYAGAWPRRTENPLPSVEPGPITFEVSDKPPQYAALTR